MPGYLRFFTLRLFAAGLATLAAATAMASPRAAALPAGFVYLRDVAPTIAQDIRYATADNFTGQPLPGYGAGECLLRRDAALALVRVEQELAGRHLGLKTYDCYRPSRAVRAMWRWAHDPARGGNKRFYPHLAKKELFARGYIALHSRHSSGIAVDLTLVPRPRPALAPYDPRKSYGPCTAPAAQRAPDDGLDMGTGFDCLDRKSYTASAAVTPAQRRRRDLLNSVMRRHGFKNYFREWWHFEFVGVPPRWEYDFPIRPRQR